MSLPFSLPLTTLDYRWEKTKKEEHETEHAHLADPRPVLGIQGVRFLREFMSHGRRSAIQETNHQHGKQAGYLSRKLHSEKSQSPRDDTLRGCIYMMFLTKQKRRAG